MIRYYNIKPYQNTARIFHKIEILSQYNNQTTNNKQDKRTKNMNIQQYEYDIIQNIIFKNFKERIISRLFNRYKIYISNEEFKRIEECSIEETKKAYAYVKAKETKAKSIENVKMTKANAMANAKANAMANAKANAMANAKANAMAMAMANAMAMAMANVRR